MVRNVVADGREGLSKSHLEKCLFEILVLFNSFSQSRAVSFPEKMSSRSKREILKQKRRFFLMSDPKGMKPMVEMLEKKI